MARILPRFDAEHERIEDERRLGRLLLDTGAELPPEARAGSVPTGDEHARRRGLPILGKGVGGTQRGTDPVGALLAKERRRRRSRSRCS